MVILSPVGLAAAPVANQLSVLATFKEKLCRPFCILSSQQPQATVSYVTGTPRLVGTTVFVPITASITIVTQGCECKAEPQLYTESFYVAFQGQTAVPSSVTLTSVGRITGGACVKRGCSHTYKIDDSITITISAT